MKSAAGGSLYRWEARQCLFQYPTNREFKLELGDFSLEFTRVLGIYGLSGSGKSTFGQLMGRVLTPSAGELIGEWVDIERGCRPLNFKYLPQQPEEFLLGMRIAQVVRRFLPDERAREFFGLLAYFELPFATISDYFGYELSAGQLRKVALAFGLSFPCDGIIMDEPTLGLSPRTRKRLLQYINEGRTDKALVLISHDWRFLEQINLQLLILAEGRVLFNGSIDQLRREAAILGRAGIDKFSLLYTQKIMAKGEVYESS